ncbi:MAG: hypothetical protein D6732_17735 [Methanobacteriota archaeon]|nr:MAG: hypothetical protein D6732_17735 [Euryarchaeota archaeon]
MERWEKIEIYILSITVILGGMISILDLAGLLETTVLKERIPTITLLLVALTASSLLVGTHNTRKFLKSFLPSVTVQQFDKPDDTLRYVLKQIRSATKSICDLTVEYESIRLTLFLSRNDYDEYRRTIKDVSERIPYREIMALRSQSRISKIRKLLPLTGKHYQLAILLDALGKVPPTALNFIIIDDEIIFANGLAVRHPSIVSYFQKYFDALWNSATLIKIGRIVYAELLDDIERQG